MQFLQNNITFFLTTLTLVSNIVCVLVILLCAFHQKSKVWIYSFVNKHILSLLFLTSLSAIIGSLAYSNVIGFEPCELCWIQRIFVYPQAILAFIAIKRGDKNIVDYLLPLSVLGGLVAFYHSLTSVGYFSTFLDCTAIGGACSKVYVLEYGYITIPFMAFSSFIYLIVISVIFYKSKNTN